MTTFPAIPARLGLLSALFMIAASLAGLLLPMYARETASLAAQGVGQDAVDLFVAAPFLLAMSWLARRGSTRALLLLGGGLAYTAYTYAVFAFGVHFNAMFLVYCAALGTSVYGLLSIVRRAGVAIEGGPRRFAAWTQIGIAALFALLWLSEIVPALLSGSEPRVVGEEGLLTNPVHVLDLALFLPALVLSGVQLLRGRPLGDLLSPIMLTLALLMSIAIAGMVVAVRAQDLPADVAVVFAFAIVAALCAAALWGLLRRVPA